MFESLKKMKRCTNYIKILNKAECFLSLNYAVNSIVFFKDIHCKSNFKLNSLK